MSKIVVTTFVNSVDNYGQVLQYYATQTFLNLRGHDTSILYPQPERIPFVRKFVSAIKNRLVGLISRRGKQEIVYSKEEQEKRLLFSKWAESIEQQEKLHPRYFERFKNENFKILKSSYTQVKSFNPDACIVGSDQTWSWISDEYFLSWVPEGCIKGAIAPSIGHAVFSPAKIDRARNLLSSFDFVTVREENGLEFCRQAGRYDAKRILDPTFLIGIEEYAKIEKNTSHNQPYILLYLLGGEISESVEHIYDFAKREGLDIVYVASQGREDDFPKCYAQVGEWLNLIRNATYVMTNSFHGMAFSIIYQKSFIVFPLVGVMCGMNGRIKDLAKMMNLESRLYSNSLEIVKQTIDFSFSVEIIRKNKETLSAILSDFKL